MKTKVIAVSSFLFNALANATSGDFTIADPAREFRRRLEN